MIDKRTVDDLQTREATRYERMMDARLTLINAYQRYVARSTHERRDELIAAVMNYSDAYDTYVD